MRKVTMAAAAFAVFAFTTTLSPAMADSYYGPVKVGNMCWKKQLGNSLGYWEQCASTAQASARGTRRR